MLRCSRSRHYPFATSYCIYFTFIRAQPDDGHHDALKHVVVASPIASYIIKLVAVLTVVHLFTLFTFLKYGALLFV